MLSLMCYGGNRYLATTATALIKYSPLSAVRKNGRAVDSSKSGADSLGYDSDHESVLKVIQRFSKDPRTWAVEDQPFAMIDRNFIGKVMHMVELRPERGFANYVPLGMFFRHFYRKLQAKANFRVFESSGVFNEDEIRSGTKQAFELISQNAHKNTMSTLVDRGVCASHTVKRFESASSQMSDRQRELLNVTASDIFAIAPGVLGPYQFIRPMLHEGEAHLAYSLLCCAFYKKKSLFDAVNNLPLLDNPSDEDRIAIPSGYGYDAPRLIFGFITFGNKSVRGPGNNIDPEVKLLDFQYLVM